MKLFKAAVILSTTLLSSGASASTLSEVKRLRNRDVYKSTHGPARVGNLATEWGRILQTDLSLSLLSMASTALSLPALEMTDDVVVVVVGTGSCDFCPEGIVLGRQNLELDDNGVTCKVLYTTAPAFTASDPACTQMKEAEFICCPEPPAVACEFCKDKPIMVDSVITETNGTTCGSVAFYSATLEGDAQECTTVKNAEVFCCPPPLPESTTCKFCDSGAVLAETIIPNSNGTTCGRAAIYAASLNATSSECTDVQMAELICCDGAGLPPIIAGNDTDTSTPTSPPSPNAFPESTPDTDVPTPAPTQFPTLKPTESVSSRYVSCIVVTSFLRCTAEFSFSRLTQSLHCSAILILSSQIVQ